MRSNVSASASSLPEDVEITYRRMNFELEGGIPRYWHSGSPAITHFFTALSIVFPEGEKFFMDSVRNFADEIHDPDLRREVKVFLQQEAHHTFQHRKYNALIEAQGIDVKRFDRMLAGALNFFRKRLSYKVQLATTVCLEHYTAVLAHQLLTEPRFTEGMDERVAALWKWHAVEETEHKAVCFDVYRHIGGSYFTRVITWARIMFGFPMGITFIMLRLLAMDGRLGDVREVIRGLSFIWGPRGVMRAILPELIAFYRRDFHPWQAANQDLIREWSVRNRELVVS
ncbi:MAG: metal-dependent hydrolase [bacterium]|nr:metal-dependent hydrolase [bacterium]